jgi:hypothetical protein
MNDIEAHKEAAGRGSNLLNTKVCNMEEIADFYKHPSEESLTRCQRLVENIIQKN